VHYFDVHGAKLLISAGTIGRYLQLPQDLVRATRGRRNYHLGGFLWDLAASYADRNAGKLISMLKTRKLDDNTIYVITADHGITTQQPLRNVGGDLTRQFNEEYLHVPLIITGKGIGRQQVSAITSHMDVGPTILELAGLTPPGGFRGQPVSQRRDDPEPYLVAENAGKGRPDMERKKLTICIHDGSFKVIYNVESSNPVERETYSLSDDPEEMRNLAHTDEYTGICDLVGGRVRTRISDINRSIKTAEFGPQILL